MKITTFNALKNHNKKPRSPFNQSSALSKSFTFTTIDVKSLKECFDVLSNNWILSNAICIDSPITTERKKVNLSHLRCPSPGVMVLDIDDIKTYEHMKAIIKHFKNSDYNVIIGKSKNWDGKEKFNLKGFMEISFTNTWHNSKKFMMILKDQIKGLGNIDISASTDVSLQAPTFRSDILLHKVDSTLKIDEDYITLNNKYIETKKQNEFIQTVDTAKLIQLCYSIYIRKGFKVIASRGETLNWEHSSEVKSRGGYFMYIDSPHIMHHHNKEKSFNIFNEIRQTKEGQDFIKEQSAYSLKKQFEEHKKIYKNELIINQPLISIDDKMKAFIKRFMTKGDVLKIKSAMGTGKSLVIDEVISEAKELSHRVLLISNRISVALDYANKYNIKTYLIDGDDAWKPGEDLIVQMDSLWKYNLKDFDIVILDEFVSLMFQVINSMKDDMRPYNSAKFHHILKNKKIVLADAFLSGYEDDFYEKKDIYYIQNNHRDVIDVMYYNKRDIFVESIIKALGEKEDDETVTASIMSNDVINAIYDIATDAGFKVFKLTGSTSDDVKKVIYKLFEKDVNETWDLLLYSPTLTVGVSNMNKCTHHFHYDAGNAADVISSLQMVKRTRRMQKLHLFLKEIVRLEPTDADTLNELFNQNIERYFKGQANGINIQVDDNANFILSPIGKFMNKIQAFQNRLENNHKLSFNVLLGEQFRFTTSVEVTERSSINFSECIKQTKQRIKDEMMMLIDTKESICYSDDVVDLLKSGRALSDNEKADIIIYEIQQKVTGYNDSELIDIAKAEVASDYKMTKRISNLLLLYKKDVLYINNQIDKIITSGVTTTEVKNEVNFLRDISKLFTFKLSDWYSENDIRDIQVQYKLNDFKQVLRRVGYDKKASRYHLNPDVSKYFKYFMK